MTARPGILRPRIPAWALCWWEGHLPHRVAPAGVRCARCGKAGADRTELEHDGDVPLYLGFALVLLSLLLWTPALSLAGAAWIVYGLGRTVVR